MSLFRDREWIKSSGEQQMPSAFLSEYLVPFHPSWENCSLCPPSDLRNSSCTPPDTCLRHRLLPPAGQRIVARYTTLMKWKRSPPNCLRHLLRFCWYWKGTLRTFKLSSVLDFWLKEVYNLRNVLLQYLECTWNSNMAFHLIGVDGSRCAEVPSSFCLLTSFSAPILLVYAASLKHCMQTALSFTTLSASGTRLRMFPNACKNARAEWVIIWLKTQTRHTMLRDKNPEWSVVVQPF